MRTPARCRDIIGEYKMTQRITLKDLDLLVGRLNRVTNSPETYSDKQPDGGFKANIGHYHLDQAYGGIKLARVYNEGGGITSPCSMGYETKRDAYRIIETFIAGIEAAR